MNLGAEPKKVAILSGLVVVAAVLFYVNVFSSSGAPEYTPLAAKSAQTPPPPISPPGARSSRPSGPSIRRAGRTASRGEFKFTMKFPENQRPDPTKIDPTLRVDLLERVQSIELPASRRNLFQFGAPPPPPPPPKVDAPKIQPKTPEQIKAEAEQTAKAAAAAKPPPPPISLKFYGYSVPSASGVKRAFFLDGEDIFVGSEGDMIKKRYKVIRIGTSSVIMEDTQHNHQQTLMLQQEQT